MDEEETLVDAIICDWDRPESPEIRIITVDSTNSDPGQGRGQAVVNPRLSTGCPSGSPGLIEYRIGAQAPARRPARIPAHA